MSKVSAVNFFRQVRQEVSKVSWATRKEVVVTSIMVLILSLISAAFFFFVDMSISNIFSRIFS